MKQLLLLFEAVNIKFSGNRIVATGLLFLCSVETFNIRLFVSTDCTEIYQKLPHKVCFGLKLMPKWLICANLGTTPIEAGFFQKD